MNSLDIFLLLRFVHIVGAILWGGAVITMALFIMPAIKSSGPEGGKVMQQIAKTNAYPAVINTAATLTLLSGFILIWNLSNGFQTSWLASTYGTLLTTGAGIGITAYAIGFVINRPSVARITAIGKEIAASGGGPSQQQLQELTRLRTRMFTATKIIAALIAVTIILMEMSRYI